MSVSCTFLERAVGALDRIVGLRVEGDRHGEFCAEAAPEVAPEMSGETTIAVGEDGLEHIVMTDDLAKEEASEFGCGDGGGGRHGVNRLGELADQHDDGIVAATSLSSRQACSTSVLTSKRQQRTASRVVPKHANNDVTAVVDDIVAHRT